MSLNTPAGPEAGEISWNRETITPIMIRAGAIALETWADPQISVKGDNSVVTEADIAIENYFESLFDHPEAGSYLLGEETLEHHADSYFADALKGSTWVVDPIDGTASYAAGLPNWGVSLAKMEAGVIVEGALLLPRLGEILLTDGGKVYHAHVNMEDPEGAPLEYRHVTGESRGDDDRGVISVSQEVVKTGIFRGRNPLQASGSCVWATFHVATGGFIAYVGTVKLWDIAGGFGILSALGYYSGFPNGDAIGNEVTDKIYQLDLSHKKPWRLHGHFISARSEETARSVWAKLSFGG